MSRRIEQINELLRSELAHLISEHLEIADCLLTVISVKTSADLRHAKVFVSVLPENLSGTALKALRRSGSFFNRLLQKKLNLKIIPKFNWIIDPNERYAAEMDQVINNLGDREITQ